MAKIYDAVLRLTDQFSEPLQKAEKHLDNFQKSYKQTGKTLWAISKKTEAVGKNFTKYVTAPIMAGAGLCVKSFKDVDDALDTVATKTGATGKDMEGFEKIFKNISKNIPEDMSAIGESIGEVNTQFGLNGETLEKASTRMLQFAKINGQNVTDASIKAKQSMDALGLSGDKLDMALDAVTKTAQNTGQSTDKIFDSITKNAPILKELNLNYAQSSEFLGQLEKSGLDTSRTFSYMSKAQVTFAKEGKSLAQGLADLQKELDKTTDGTERTTLMAKYFGTKGATFMSDALQRGVLDFDKFANAQKDAMGSVANTYDEILDPIDRFKQLFNELKLVGKDFFKASEKIWSPVLEKGIKKLGEFVDKIEKMPEEKVRSMIKTFMGLAAVGPILIGIEKVEEVLDKAFFKMSDFAGAVKKAGGILKWLKSPTTLAVGAILLLVGVGILLWKNWDKIKAKAEKTFPGITKTVQRMSKNIGKIIKALVKLASSVGKSFLKKFKSFWKKIEPIAKVLGTILKRVVGDAIKILDGLLEFLAGLFTRNWRQAWDGIVKIFDTIFGGIKNIGKRVINGLIDIINKGINSLNKIQVPDWIPGVGGKGVNIPVIPKLARGTENWLGGLAHINERGGEIVDLPRGSRVVPHDRSLKDAFEQGKNSVQTDNSLVLNIPKLAETMVIREDADIDKIINSLVKELKIAKQNKINSRGVMV